MEFHAIRHFKTITYHKLLVAESCFRVGLYRQGLLHDMSKYSPTEFLVGCKYYQGYQSPNNAERLNRGYSSAWLHHKGRNKHHFEYWTDYSIRKPGHPIEGMRMPRRYVAEMLMDRIAASKVYNGENYTDHDPLEYFLKGKAHYMLHPKTEREIEGLLRMLDQRGEEYLYGYVKNVYLAPLHRDFRKLLPKKKRKQA
ncbi:Uncharacterised protein [uncultured Clostridium sp.]|nr:Uncharacterised protein [uncultured Clostridium sp.]